jgi:hypothetical protein
MQQHSAEYVECQAHTSHDKDQDGIVDSVGAEESLYRLEKDADA